MKSAAQNQLVRLLRCAAASRLPENADASANLEARVIRDWRRSRAEQEYRLDTLSVFQRATFVACTFAVVAAAVNLAAFSPANDPQAHVANYALVAALDR